MTSSTDPLIDDDFDSPSLDEQVAGVKRRFAEIYGASAQWMAAAPGRVNLIGEHTDYNAGFVFPLAIERYTVIAGGRPDGRAPRDRVRVHSTMFDESSQFALDHLEP